MAARKIRFDESFIPRPGAQATPTATPATDAAWRETYVTGAPSPARAMQDRLLAEIEGRYGVATSPDSDTRLHPAVSLAIVVGSSAILWVGIVAAIMPLFG